MRRRRTRPWRSAKPAPSIPTMMLGDGRWRRDRSDAPTLGGQWRGGSPRLRRPRDRRWRSGTRWRRLDASAGAETAGRRRRGAAPPPVDPDVALGQRGDLLHHADERADDLQRASAALLGRVRRQLRSRLAADRRRRTAAATSGSARSALDTTGVLGIAHRGRAGAEPRLPRLGDHPLQLRPGAVAALAPDLRLGLRARACWPTASAASSTATCAATCCRGRPSSRRAMSGRTSRRTRR